MPVFLNLAGRPCLVIGGGGPAEEKVRALLAAGAGVRLVDDHPGEALEAIAAADSRLELERRPYRTSDLDGCWLAFLAHGDAVLRAQVERDAERARIWLNAIDVPEACSFTMPAILRRGRITVAVGTGGASPRLAGVVRDRIAASLGEEYPAAAEHLAGLRARFAPGRARQQAFQSLLAAGLVEALRRGDRARVAALTEAACAGLVDRAEPGTEPS